MMAAEARAPKPFDPATVRNLGVAAPRDGKGFTLPCGSLPDARWFCASVGPGREGLARDRLEGLGFGAFLPVVTRRVRHARQTWIAARPLFPRYLFLRFDARRDAWKRAYTLGLGVRIFGASPERPTPLPAGLVEGWIAEGFDRPIGRDLAPDLIAAGAEVRLTDGPFCDSLGVCLWDDGRRVRVLLSLLGRQVQAEVARERVARA